MTKEKLVELLRGCVGHLSLSVANDLIAHGVTVEDRLVPKCVVISEKYGSPRCPSCNAILRGRSSHYCWQCGQKVRWYPPDPKGE